MMPTAYNLTGRTAPRTRGRLLGQEPSQSSSKLQLLQANDNEMGLRTNVFTETRLHHTFTKTSLHPCIYKAQCPPHLQPQHLRSSYCIRQSAGLAWNQERWTFIGNILTTLSSIPRCRCLYTPQRKIQKMHNIHMVSLSSLQFSLCNPMWKMTNESLKSSCHEFCRPSFHTVKLSDCI